MSDYEPGQRVRLKSWDELKEICEEDGGGDLCVKGGGGCALASDKHLYGKEYEVKGGNNDEGIHLNTGEEATFFYPWEIEPITDNENSKESFMGHEVVVSDELPKKKRTWEVITEARSSDGITVTRDGLKIEYGGSPECLGHLEIDTSAKNCRELMNKLRKGLEMYKKLNK